MPGPLRYQNPELQDLLASNYVTGTLRGAARRRMERLMREDQQLSRRVRQWEGKLQPLHQCTPAIAPKKSTWKRIVRAINGAADPVVISLTRKLTFYKYFSGFALTSVLVMALMLGVPSAKPERVNINYVAVMKNNEEQPTMVVTLTKAGRVLTLDMLQKPTLNKHQGLQLWAISKVDGSVASLGVIEVAKHSEKALSKPQWGLITNAAYLMVSVETRGSVAKPSHLVVAKGLCVKVEGWKAKTG